MKVEKINWFQVHVTFLIKSLKSKQWKFRRKRRETNKSRISSSHWGFYELIRNQNLNKDV